MYYYRRIRSLGVHMEPPSRSQKPSHLPSAYQNITRKNGYPARHFHSVFFELSIERVGMLIRSASTYLSVTDQQSSFIRRKVEAALQEASGYCLWNAHGTWAVRTQLHIPSCRWRNRKTTTPSRMTSNSSRPKVTHKLIMTRSARPARPAQPPEVNIIGTSLPLLSSFS
jgi:hypothetical protein